MADISLLFDVAMGGGNPSGDSEQLIRSQLEAIVNGINSKPFSIKFQADEQSLQQFQKRVSEIAVSLGGSVGTSSAAFEQVTRQINIAATAIHTMNGAVNASNLERISTALSGMAGANISDGAIADIVSRLESMSVVLTDARIQFEDLGKEGERVPRLIIEGIDAAGNAIRRNLRFDNKGELERDLTDITVKLAEVEKASKSSGTSTNSSGEKATDAFSKAKKAVTDYYSALTQLERSGLRNVITQNSDGVWSSSQEGYGERVAQLNRLTQEYHNATAARKTFTASQQTEFTEHETARTQQYRVAVEDVARAEQQRRETLRSTVTITRSYDNTIADCQKKLKDWSAAENSRHQSSREAYDALRNEVIAANQARTQYKNGEITIEQYTAAMDRLKSTLVSTKTTLQQNGDAAKTLSEKLTGLAKKFASWLGVSQIIMYIYRSIRKMVTAIIELDTAMTELKKVTDETDATYDKFLRNAATRAKRLGASLTDVVKTSADFARLGLSLDDAETVSDAALVYRNVGDGIEDIDQASESLISTMQAFGIKAADVMTIVDKFNVAGNNFAISSGGVGDALLNSASALAAANNTLEESIALITAANETIQNPEKVGTALKTLSMYIRAAKTEAEEAGISTDGMANSVSELREEILSLTGNRVDIMIDDDTFKSTYQIIKELSEVWGTLSETTKSNITELIGGGVRNANVINALMANMSTAAEVVEKTSNSAGSAMAENAKVLESVEGKISVLKAMFEELSQSLISSGFVKNIVDFGTDLLNILLHVGVLIEKLGGLNNVLMITAGIIATIKGDAIVASLVKILSFGTKIKTFFTDLKLAFNIARADGIGRIKSLAAAFDAVGISASAAQIAVFAFVAALTAVVMISSHLAQKQKEIRNANIENAKTAKEEADSLRDLINQYKRLAEAEKWDESSRTQAKTIQEQITNLVGAQADNLDLVNGKLDDEIKKLDEIALKTAEQNSGKLLVAKKSAEDALMSSVYDPDWYSSKVDPEIYHGAWQTNAERNALTNVLKELNLTKYDAGGWFRIDISSIDAVLQSYRDMEKLQQHLVANYKEEISAGGNLNDFYNDLSERIINMSTAVEEYNTAISNYHENEAIRELGKYLQSNDIDSKEDFDAYINSVKSSTAYSEAYKQVLIDLANNTFPQFADAVKDTAEEEDKATTATNKFATALSKVNKLAAGLDQLDSIYADIYDKKDFDWSSILGNEDFTNAFGGLGDAYDDFIKTVANAPDDIGACQDAFDKLATAYILNSDALESVTDETRNATVAMLEQMGVANAASIVDARLAYNKELLRLQTILGEDATYADINALYQQAEAGSLTAQILAQLAATKLLTNETGIQTVGDIEQLEGLAKSANATEASLLRVAQAKALMAKAEKLDSMAANWKPGAGFDNYLSYVEQAEAARKEAQELLSKPLEYNEIDFSKYKVQYSGGSATSSAKDKSGNSKEETWFEKQLSMHQHLVAMNQETQEAYLTWLNSAYKKAYDEGIIDLNDYYKYTEEVYQGLQDLVRDYLRDVEHEISMRSNYDGEAKKIIELYEVLIKKVEKEIAEARARGLTDEDDYIQELQSKWQDYTGSIKDLQDEITDAAKDALDELVDYRIDMLKQEIENEKDALDERLDNLKEFYDKQKEMLQDQRDEENYLKDQSDKRKTVADLQAELAMLANDDSAWAQKRKLEIKEELATAQEDLDEFEKDHALDLALDAIDKAYNDQEAQLQAEMDALDERLNDPEALFNKALEDIRNNSENQLYYQMLMYNKQFGDGNDETVKELWESAFGALTDYEKLFGKLYQDVKLENETGVEDEGGWDDEGISGTNPGNQQPAPPPANEGAKEEPAAPTLTDDIKKKVAAAIWNGGYGWGTGSTRTQRLAEVFGANNGIQALVNKGVGRSGVSLTSEYTYANMRKKFKGYAAGTTSAIPGLHRVDELGPEYLFVSPSDGTRYRMFTGGEKVLNADATDFLYQFANSGGTVLTKMLADLFKVGGFGNIAKPVQAIELSTGDIVIQGSCDNKTVSEIRRAQRAELEFFLKELNKLNR